LLLGFRVGAIGDDNHATLEPQSLGGLSALQRLSARNPVSALAEHVVISKALLHHGTQLALGQVLERCFRRVSQADESHGFPPFGRLSDRSPSANCSGRISPRQTWHLPDRPDFDDAPARARPWMPRDDANRLVQVLGLDQVEAAKLLARLGEWAVGDE